jgi:hypothetical protein
MNNNAVANVDTNCNCNKLKLNGIFNPIVKVIPTDDWSKIKAIWIPLLHHDYLNQLERSENITILEPRSDKFGTVQGYLTAPHENYIPYLTTFFNPTWTKDFIIEQIVQAHDNIIESIHTIIDDNDIIIKRIVIGKTNQKMTIKMILDQNNHVIDASPLFYKE